MKIKFTGYYNIPEENRPDDRGTVDVWLLGHIAEVIAKGPESDDIYEKLKLSWEVYYD